MSPDTGEQRADRQFEAVPALGPLFARAVFGRAVPSKATRPGQLSEDRLTARGQPVDTDRLARYQRLCGFRVTDVLPPTYLHLMSFPLAVARMVEPDFPFPLLGLVHIGNTIRQHRPVTAAEPVSVSAWAANVREHPAGRQVELSSQALVGDELVWSETSNYLHRESSAADRPDRPRADVAPPPTGPVIRWRAPADIGRRYAAVSGDRNPIHLHNLTARAFGFRAAIAHGMWLKARTLAAFEGRLATSFTVEVGFKTPVFLPSEVELIAAPEATGWSFEAHGARSGKPHLTGTIS